MLFHKLALEADKLHLYRAVLEAQLQGVMLHQDTVRELLSYANWNNSEPIITDFEEVAQVYQILTVEQITRLCDIETFDCYVRELNPKPFAPNIATLQYMWLYLSDPAYPPAHEFLHECLVLLK